MTARRHRVGSLKVPERFKENIGGKTLGCFHSSFQGGQGLNIKGKDNLEDKI